MPRQLVPTRVACPVPACLPACRNDLLVVNAEVVDSDPRAFPSIESMTQDAYSLFKASEHSTFAACWRRCWGPQQLAAALSLWERLCLQL